MTATERMLDLITMGRSSVDLYGQQIGTRLEDVASFAKSVGGCPSNIAIGTARLGLASGVITRVGDEQMGRFIREQMAREGVATQGIATDPERLTALVLLAVENEKGFPLIFYRDHCADMALCEDDVDESFVASARAILVSGTHFSTPGTEAAQRKAMRIARANGGRVVFDIDYRPNLWGLAGHDAGDSRYISSAAVSDRLRSVLPDCDLIVGTEEEVLIASGEADLLAALKTIRAVSDATIVLKRGPMGCIVYAGAITDRLEDGIVGRGFPIEVYNVLGAGDAFLSGFLRGWLTGEDHATSATWANACGAFAVSRLLCSPEIPTFKELQYFLTHGSRYHALRKDPDLNHVHWVTTRRGHYPLMMALACDHRMQLEQMCADEAQLARLPAFKRLVVAATRTVAQGRPGFGLLIDDKYGRDALFDAGSGRDLWVAKPVELPGSRPLKIEFSPDLGSRLIDWPVDHVVKVLCFYHPDDPSALKAEQIETLRVAYDAARKVGREILIEIIASKHGPLDDSTFGRALTEIYDAGLRPDWWKLESQPSAAAWETIDTVLEDRDPWCRGVLLLGLDAPIKVLQQGFAIARGARSVRGFAVGRTIFAEAARRWLAGEIDDAAAVGDMAGRFKALVDIWQAPVSVAA